MVVMRIRIVWCLFWLFLIVAVIADVRYLRIPNWLTLPGAIVFIVLSALCQVQPFENVMVGVGVSSGLVFALVIASGGRMGMGDVKLYLTVGAMLGPALGVLSFLMAAFAGSILGTVLSLSGRLKPGQPMPFGPSILCGVVGAVYLGPFILSWYSQQLATPL